MFSHPQYTVMACTGRFIKGCYDLIEVMQYDATTIKLLLRMRTELLTSICIGAR